MPFRLGPNDPDPIERKTCVLCGGPRNLEHERTWRHQSALSEYERRLEVVAPEKKWSDALEAGWISNYVPWNWTTRDWSPSPA
jgi:hypothetical protein